MGRPHGGPHLEGHTRGRGREQGPPTPTSCFVPPAGSPYPHQLWVTSEGFVNVLIVCSWPPLALMSSLSTLIKETIVAWSP